MRRMLILVMCIFLASQIVVHVDIEQQIIQGYEEQTGPTPIRTAGDWKLQLYDGQLLLGTYFFDPTITFEDNTQSLVTDMWVTIPKLALANTIALVNPQGETLHIRQIRAYCGDGRCDPMEVLSCPQDCTPEAQHQSAFETEQDPFIAIPQRSSLTRYLLLAGISLLILILVLVLIKINRKKPIQQEGYY